MTAYRALTTLGEVRAAEAAGEQVSIFCSERWSPVVLSEWPDYAIEDKLGKGYKFHALTGPTYAELLAQRDAMKAALQLFVDYDSSDPDDDIALMTAYNDAIIAARAALAQVAK